jgi:hypothetical protein
MQTLARIGATLGVVGAIAASSVIPASALDIYIGHGHRHHYYDYGGGGWNTWNGCPSMYTIQGGVCKPYQGPIYGPGRWGYYR